MTGVSRRPAAGALVALALALAGGCAANAIAPRDGLDFNMLPVAVRDDYQLFALRCSKCHSLARPLHSGIVDDGLWVSYVNRMRRQPASGISSDDAVRILRFLSYYADEQRRARAAEGK